MRVDNSVYYVLKDPLGSAMATTDSSGNVVGEMRYYATGETRLLTGNMFTDRLFTGQCQMAGLGIYQFGARFYSPELGRFLSADPMGQNIAVPQAFNRYSYALNNPIRYTDPSGYRICDDVDAYGNCITYDYGDDGSSTSGGSTWIGGGGGDGGDGDGDGGGGGGYLASPLAVDITYFDTTINDLYATPTSMEPEPCSTNGQACMVGGALLIIFTDLFVGLPAAAVIIWSGGVTPPAIAAEAIETFVVLPVNILGIYLIVQGSKY